jgi:hypothetical protein|tara:strand:+ start:63 stop:212 length:150 start_codon:yes stop_codon:yes gene_type:complete
MIKSRSSYISKKKPKFWSYKENKQFWDGAFYGVLIGYMPYIIHMNQWLR